MSLDCRAHSHSSAAPAHVPRVLLEGDAPRPEMKVLFVFALILGGKGKGEGAGAGDLGGETMHLLTAFDPSVCVLAGGKGKGGELGGEKVRVLTAYDHVFHRCTEMEVIFSLCI